MHMIKLTHRQLFFALLDGKQPDKLPFFPDISDWYKGRRQPPNEPQAYNTGALIPDDSVLNKNQIDMPPEFASWRYLDFYRNFDWGLPVHIYHTDWLKEHHDGYQYSKESNPEGSIQIWETPHGTLKRIDRTASDGSSINTKYMLQSLDDFKALEYIINHTYYEPDYGLIDWNLKTIGEMGVADVVIWRSPFGKFMQEYAGLVQLAYWMADDAPRVLDLVTLQAEHDMQVIEMAAKSKARLIIISDHADEALLNPRWYKQYCIPFYRQATDHLHKHGKLVSTHLDGNIKRLMPLLKETGFDLLDGTTPAPMTNWTPAELAPHLSEKMYAYCGVPSTFFAQNLPDEQILASAEEIVSALHGRVILNVGDVLPGNGNLKQVIGLGDWSRKVFSAVS